MTISPTKPTKLDMIKSCAQANEFESFLAQTDYSDDSKITFDGRPRQRLFYDPFDPKHMPKTKRNILREAMGELNRAPKLSPNTPEWDELIYISMAVQHFFDEALFTLLQTEVT